MADNKISVEIDIDDSGVSKSFAGIESQAAKTFSSIGTIIGVATAGAATAVAGIFAKQSIDAAKEFQDAVNRFNVALANSGKYSKQASADFLAFAQSIQETTRFSDDQVLSTATLIQNLGRLSNEGLKQATVAATNLATALGIDLNTAASLIGKSANGNIATFQRYGIVIQKGATDAETFANTLKTLNERFGGAAAKDVNTFSGAIALFTNTFDDLKKTIGGFVVSSPAVVASIKFISTEIANLTGLISKGAGSDVFKGIISSAIDLGIAINTLVIQPFEVFGNIAVAVVDTVKTGLQTIVFGLSGVGLGITEILNKLGLASDAALANAQAFNESSKAVLDDFVASTQGAFSNLFDTSATDGINTFLENFKSAVDQSAPLANQLSNNINTGLDSVRNKVKQAEFDIKSRLGQGISNTIQSVTGALLKGQNAFAAFGKSILGTFGDLAIQLGTFFIIQGIAIDAVKAISGAGAIAAGAALVALGVLLKSLSGGEGGVGAAASGTPGVSGTPSDSNPSGSSGQISPDEKIDRGPQVVVNVEGQILDPVGTATRIAELLADVTNSNDITVRA